MALAAVILAAGLGKRMKSSLPKVVHVANGRPLIRWVADAAREAGATQLVAVIGPEMSDADLRGHLDGFDTAVQRDRLGTGHATQQAMGRLNADIDEVLVLCGDAPCVRAETLRHLVEARRSADAGAAVLTMVLSDPGAYGRIVRASSLTEAPSLTGVSTSTRNPGPVERIVEDRDATPDEKAICEVNSGTYAFARADLERGLANLKNENAQGEYYLTDVVRYCVTAGRGVVGVIAADSDEALGVNTTDDLALVGRILEERARKAIS